MTVMLPVGRACTRQLLSRSNHLVTRFAPSNPLLRVSNCNSDNNQSSQSCPLPLDKKFLLARYRAYATEAAAKPRGRPKAHTGRTVAKKSAAKPKATTAKKTTKAKSKPKAKKTKSKAKAKPKAKSKRAVKRPPSKNALNQARISKTKDLKAKALLDEPKALPASAWQLHVAKTAKGSKSTAEANQSFKEASQTYKSLPPEEHEQLNHTANQNKAKNEAEYKKWVSQHTPLEIKNANNARNKLNQEAKAAGKKKHIAAIKDDRIVKRPVSTFAIFTKERWASGDFKNMALAESTRLIAREYKALSTNEKGSLTERAKADLNRYNEEAKSVYRE